MTGVLVLLGVLIVPYLAWNVRRLRRGERWAVTFCDALRQADERARAQRRAARR